MQENVPTGGQTATGHSAFAIRYPGGSDPRGRGDRRLLEPHHLQVFAVAFGEPGAEPVTASIRSLRITP